MSSRWIATVVVSLIILLINDSNPRKIKSMVRKMMEVKNKIRTTRHSRERISREGDSIRRKVEMHTLFVIGSHILTPQAAHRHAIVIKKTTRWLFLLWDFLIHHHHHRHHLLHTYVLWPTLPESYIVVKNLCSFI